MYSDVLIQLLAPMEWEFQSLLGFPEATHLKLVNVSFESSRPRQNRVGWVDMWFAPGMLAADGQFVEFPGMPGVNLRIEDPVFPEVVPINGPLQLITAQIMSQFALDEGVVLGTIVVIEA